MNYEEKADLLRDIGFTPEWQKPIPFKNVNLPAFPVEVLPCIISDYVRAVAETTQTSPDMSATAALAILALSLQGKFLIEGKKDWREPLNLYTIVIAPPAERKSAVMAHMTEPLKRYEITENERLAPLIEQNKIDRIVLEKKKKFMEDNLAKGKLGTDRSKVRELSELLSNFKDIKPCRLFCDDITPEKLASVLYDNDGRTALLSAEGGIFDTLAGRYSGGPAKVAVIASAFQGTVSGSSVANAASTGPFTIPAMKRLGYKPEFAGAVEAAASTGGQIVPPVMGAAAFLMAEITGYAYGMIVVASIIPAMLYFAGVLISTHHKARKLGLRGLDPENVPKAWPLMKDRGYLIMPLVFIIYMLATRATPSFAAMGAMLASLLVYSAKWWGIVPIVAMAIGKDILNLHFTQYTLLAIGVWLVICLIRRHVGISLLEILEILRTGARNALSVVIACATAGMIVGAVTLTGVGLTFGNALASLAGGNIFLLMIFTMFASLILGLGIPTTAKYLIIATVCAPAMISSLVVMQGLDAPTTAIILSVHMFVFYFGVAADITPPVALVSMATSAIAGSDTFKTSVTASRLAIAAFLVPFIFVLHPAMLLIDTTFIEATPFVITALIGMYSLSGGLAGYVHDKCTLLERLMLIGGGLFMVYPEFFSDIVGLVSLGLVIFMQRRRVSRRVAT